MKEDKRFEQFVRGEISENAYLGKREEGVFEVGDRVLVLDHVGTNGMENQIGIVRTIDEQQIFVEFYNNIGGHRGYDQAEDGHGWWCYAPRLKFIQNDTE